MQVKIRASGMNQVSQIPRANLSPVEHAVRGLLYLCDSASDDLIGEDVVDARRGVPQAHRARLTQYLFGVLAQQRLAIERPGRLVLEAHDRCEVLAAVVGDHDGAALQ